MPQAAAQQVARATPARSPSELPAAPLKATPQANGTRFLLYAPGDSAADRPGETYEQRVVRMARAHLAALLGTGVDQIAVAGESSAELAQADPCGAGAATGAAPGGIRPGREVVLRAGGGDHRYRATGGIGYYCGPLPTP